MSTYRDFIPDGEDLGGLGSGFRDFVPTPEPVKKEIFTCKVCGFETVTARALGSHMRVHPPEKTE